MLEQSLDRTKATRYIILCKNNDESVITFTNFLSASLPFYNITLYQLLEPSITYFQCLSQLLEATNHFSGKHQLFKVFNKRADEMCASTSTHTVR